MPSGLLYKKYCKLVSKPVVDRAYRNYMKKMVELGLVKADGFGRWKIYEVVVQNPVIIVDVLQVKAGCIPHDRICVY